MSREDWTLEQLDRALERAREEGASDEDLVLLWLARGDVLGVPVTDHTLVHLMGITLERARDLFANLGERGLVEQEDEDSP